MKPIIKNLILIMGIVSSISAFSQNMTINKSTVNQFDLNKYLGTWYEIARYDHSFERHLVGVTAHYQINEKGKIIVTNRGFKHNFEGKQSEAIGKAKVKDPNIPAHLRVSFFLFFYSDYLILELDDDYQWAVVGSKSDKYLWILSRKPYLAADRYNLIINRIKERGYPTEPLIMVEQNMDNYIETSNQ